MVTALIGAHDLAVGTYTSPHLEAINERISRNGEPISDAALAALLTDLAALEPLVAHTPSYFELLTAAAFRWFAEEAVGAAVVEVGLLGRWDATNVVDGVVAVLTNVGHDHTDGQGDWRRRIAEEKAGIVKPGSHLRAGRDRPRAAGRLRRHARGRGVAARRRLRLHRQPLGDGRPDARPKNPGSHLRRGVLGAARRPPGRQRRHRAGGRRGLLRSTPGPRPRGRGLRRRAQPRPLRGGAARSVADPRRCPQLRRGAGGR